MSKAAHAPERVNSYVEVFSVYQGSDGEATRRLYDALRTRGEEGALAVDVFRAQKASERAKVYRGGNAKGRYRAQAYEKKQWSMGNLSRTLLGLGPSLRLTWGWAIDPRQELHRHILYIDLPTGQVSWHGSERFAGPDYPGEWDQARGTAPDRICRWIARILQEGQSPEASHV